MLVATGRRPNGEGLGLEEAGVQVDAQGRVVVDERFATSAEGVYAIGDLIHGPMLAHKAEEDGVALAEMLATGHGHVDYGLVPSVVYTDPEIASVGRSEEGARRAGRPRAQGRVPVRRQRPRAGDGAHRGQGQDPRTPRHRPRAGRPRHRPARGDLIAEAVAAMAFHASSEDVARVVHAHPTLAEVVKEAALAVDGRALHI